jgi:hypothetical protein
MLHDLALEMCALILSVSAAALASAANVAAVLANAARARGVRTHGIQAWLPCVGAPAPCQRRLLQTHSAHTAHGHTLWPLLPISVTAGRDAQSAAVCGCAGRDD